MIETLGWVAMAFAASAWILAFTRNVRVGVRWSDDNWPYFWCMGFVALANSLFFLDDFGWWNLFLLFTNLIFMAFTFRSLTTECDCESEECE